MNTVIHSREDEKAIFGFAPAIRDPFERGRTLKVKVGIGDTTAFQLNVGEELRYLDSATSRYDGFEIYYWERKNGEIIEIWWPEVASVIELLNHFY